MFFKKKFEIFAELGDLSKFTFDELKSQVKGFKLEVQIENEIMEAKWYNSQSIVVINYKLNGNFIKIKSNTWLKPYYQHFEINYKFI